MRISVAFLACLVLGCRGQQQLRDDCVTEASVVCPSCVTDDECMIISNRCYANASCTHQRRNPPLVVTAIGCNMEYERPAASRCGCVDGVCRSR